MGPPVGRKRRVLAPLEQVGLSEYADRWSTQLSGAQRQRLASARARHAVRHPA
ncbi:MULTISPECIES: hypothetical protein [Streptomyces]|uniref:hypothetical protein n=1 Tax=Streptomyces TaxID=1883 RepID=UPI001C65429B|nr:MULTISPECIES: hypothetical protein [unclassified Streptomyces]